jgi:membrane-associated phospholipid phosphatase
VTLLVWSARRARGLDVSEREARIFRLFNDAPDRLEAPLWAVMQAGSLGGVFVVAGAKRAAGRPRDAMIVLVIGTAVWLGVKLVKPLIGRGRPAHHLDGVKVRGQDQTGLGYPSGHAAVSTTLALTATSAGPARLAGLSVAAIAGSSRMYVGAHLPLDVAAGYAVGALAGPVGGRLVRSDRRAPWWPASRGRPSRPARRWRP